ncbi:MULTISPECIES: hypothetical protein [Rhizobium]|uniref:Uncharacterized protein n=1 Tax=Rhizobium phaseoli TaxID=396 RepID=A0A7T0EFH8_9HYPH|nr:MULTISPECIES: hypothetical protein [Rhizobium]ANL40413.1 hypothetical protein AMC88_CH02023 [Rhizobium phaseoli]ANL59401.1 hypothetical protein AMC85_CH02022 [Rhizobium phaseoli]MDE8762828.1 hypothetical protein [Rhizobium sp. CBK13]QPK10758.1 hypothetical protein HER27_009525 [Rhizobium phaseoli]
MAETIGEAMDAGWEIRARCAWGRREGLKSVRECQWKLKLDIVTLVATRGRDFPLAMLSQRMRCPVCGSRRVAIAYLPKDTPRAMTMARNAKW